MKKMISAALMLLATVSMNSTNTITMGDSVRINPNKLDGYSQQTVTMYNDGYCDSWNMAVTYPQGLTVKLVAGVAPLDGMTVPYVDRYGNNQVYQCPLNVSAAYATISSEITVNGYWDYRGIGEYDPYGTVKWSAGAHNMFEYNFYVDPSFRRGYVIFDGRITSGSDQRGPILQDVRFYSKTWVWVGYKLGDVSGDERINITDVMLLINYISEGCCDWNEFQVAAADFNGDGEINISDAVALINYIKNK